MKSGKYHAPMRQRTHLLRRTLIVINWRGQVKDGLTHSTPTELADRYF